MHLAASTTLYSQVASVTALAAGIYGARAAASLGGRYLVRIYGLGSFYHGNTRVDAFPSIAQLLSKSNASFTVALQGRSLVICAFTFVLFVFFIYRRFPCGKDSGVALRRQGWENPRLFGRLHAGHSP